MNRSKTHISVLLQASILSCAMVVAPAADAQEHGRRAYDLPSQPLMEAVRALALQSGETVLIPSELGSDRRAPALSGQYTVEEALKFLLAGSGLTYARSGGSYAVTSSRPNETAGGSDADILVTGSRIRGAGPVGSPLITLDRAAIEQSGRGTTQDILQSLPQNFGGGANEATLGSGVRNGAGANTGFGSSINLRGLGTSSTLVLFNGNRAALGGFSGVFADLSLVPASIIERVEILSDGASAIYGSDAVAGVVNILFRDRFVGAESRFRLGTADGDYEELQASQLYGKAWTGGHLVLAYQYDQRGRLPASDRSFVTENLTPYGGLDYRSTYANPGTIVAANGAAFGIPRGQNGMALTAAQLLPGVTNREDARRYTDVLPRQRTHSFYGSFHQDLGARLSLYGQGNFARRSYDARGLPLSNAAVTVPVTNAFYVDPIGTRQPVRVLYSFIRDLGPVVQRGDVQGYNGTVGLTREAGAWRLDAHGTYGEQKERNVLANAPNRARLAAALADPDRATAYNVFGDGSFTNPATIERIRGSTRNTTSYRVFAAAGKADGPLFALPAGDVRLALGGEYRTERFRYAAITDINTLAPTAVGLSGLPGTRRISAGYAELFLPVFGPSNRRTALERLEVSVAGRYEHYSDVGTTTNPKIGLAWSPIGGVTARASYGRSFRAPAFTELVGEANSLYQPLLLNDPASPTGTSKVLGLFGYNPDLGPERASTWTAGLDLRPQFAPGLSIAATWFSISYRDRIASASQDYATFLTNRAIYGGLVTDTPDPATLARYYTSRVFSNPLNIPASDIVAIIDGRTTNLATVTVRGIDFDLGYSTALGGGTLAAGIAGSYLTRFAQQVTTTSPSASVLGTLGYPVDLRFRGRLSWTQGRFNVAAFANYTGDYINRVPAVPQSVPSWTTFDLQLGVALSDRIVPGGMRLSVNAANLFDRNPPFVINPSAASTLAYDPEKGSPVGRTIAVQITKSW